MIDEVEINNKNININYSDSGSVFIDSEISDQGLKTAKALKPWRKGPFEFKNIKIDAEWNSDIKYSIIRPHLNLINIKNKIVGDIGCNNGYYMFRMLEFEPEKIVGFDPSAIYKNQFDFVNKFLNIPENKIKFELLGVEHLPFYEHKFDVLLCLGVLYHRSDPIATLKILKNSLNEGGTLILDTFYIDGEEEVALFPNERYAKMRNIFFIPTISALRNWAKRARFQDFEIIAKVETTEQEQRKTEWMDWESLEDFLDPNDKTKTIEGYPAPKRVYVKFFNPFSIPIRDNEHERFKSM